MAIRRKLQKMIGPATWVQDDLPFRGQVSRAILRDGVQMSLDLEHGGWTYSIRLEQESGDLFRGIWSSKEGKEQFTGSVSARLYSSDAGYLLFGDWVEGGARYHWWVELCSVEQFPDETGD